MPNAAKSVLLFSRLIGMRDGVVFLRIVELTLQVFAQICEVSCLLQALNGCLPNTRNVNVPCSEASQDNTHDAREDCEENVVDWHDILFELRGIRDGVPEPGAAGCKTQPAEE